jgi:pheromone shutdown protein TraB
MTEEELKGFVNDNPDLWFYQLVYGLTFGIMLFVGLMKGIGIARQLLLGKLLHWISMAGHINLISSVLYKGCFHPFLFQMQ